MPAEDRRFEPGTRHFSLSFFFCGEGEIIAHPELEAKASLHPKVIWKSFICIYILRASTFLKSVWLLGRSARDSIFTDDPIFFFFPLRFDCHFISNHGPPRRSQTQKETRSLSPRCIGMVKNCRRVFNRFQAHGIYGLGAGQRTRY